MAKQFDVTIIGTGPAGLTAGIYTSRAKLRTVLMDKEAFGGYINNIELVDNFPGSANISRKGIDVFTAWACTENSGKMARKMIADTRFKLLIDNIMTFVGREDKNRVHY